MLAVLLLVAAAQDTPAPAPTPAPTATPAKPKQEPGTCRPIRDSVSRIGAGRECHTAAEWNRMGDDLDGHTLDRATGN